MHAFFFAVKKSPFALVSDHCGISIKKEANIMFLLHVEKNKLILLKREPVTSGSVNIYDVRFEFSADWERLDRVAVFRAGCVSREVQLGPSGACLVPWEVLRVPGYQLKVGVYGKQGEEVVLPTAWVSLGMILEGVILEDVPTGGLPPSLPGLWEQELARKGDRLSYTEEGELGLYSGDKLLSSVPVSSGGGEPGVPGPPGPQGEPGPAGEQGPKGEDGFSPIVSISEISGGHQVTVRDAAGQKSFPVMDGLDGNPVGTVISFLGLTAPAGYLVCDGAEYEIADYPALAELFHQQFGAENHFGGNGTDTFCVPDMRNLFLRGYHGAAEEQLSGEVGEQQKATEIPNLYSSGSAFGGLIDVAKSDMKKFNSVKHPDKKISSCNVAFYAENLPSYNMNSMFEPLVGFEHYSPRPINMAVLYCVKAI